MIQIILAIALSIMTYQLDTVVTEVDRTNDIVTVTDESGNQWEFTECEDWMEGDCCRLTMSNNGTIAITDDIITDVQYTGCLLCQVPSK